jgi:hypothetical protein
MDGSGRLHISDAQTNVIETYTPDAAGNAAPLSTIAGPLTTLASPNAVIASSLPYVANHSLPAATVGSAYHATLSGYGGVSPYHWLLAAGTLPAGLSLDPNTGAITGTPTTPQNAQFTVRVTDSKTPSAGATTHSLSIAVAPPPAVYVANGGVSRVSAYALGGSGNERPVVDLEGANTALSAPTSLVLDNIGALYVGNAGNDSITEYTPGATGNVQPAATIAGPATGLSYPAGLTLDSSRRLYAANRSNNSVTVYVPGVSGNTGPVQNITGPDTRLSAPVGVTVDDAGNIWVLNNAANSITEYAPGATGDAAPIATISGSATGLHTPQALGRDSAGDLVVANEFGQTITAYAPGSTGNAPPVRTITGLDSPAGLDFDANGNLYISNQFAGNLLEFAPGASGAATPQATIAGPDTALSAPGAVAVSPPLSIITHTLPHARARRPYDVTLQAALGTAPYRWSIAAGRLPSGLRLDRSLGEIAGTPLTAGRWTFTVTVRDASRPTMISTQRLTIRVAPRADSRHGAAGRAVLRPTRR